jgi:hypothetical protein
VRKVEEEDAAEMNRVIVMKEDIPAGHSIFAHSQSAFSGPPRYPDIHRAKSAQILYPAF